MGVIGLFLYVLLRLNINPTIAHIDIYVYLMYADLLMF